MASRMNWGQISQAVSDLLCLFLVVRLLLLRLGGVYRLFCLFVVLQVFGSGMAFLEEFIWFHYPGYRTDYRTFWIPLQVVTWTVTLTMLYFLLKATLATLPGILKFSRKVLQWTYLLALLAGLWSAQAEYASSAKASSYLAPLARAVTVTIILNRAVCSAALLILIVILCFVLWFPVQMPKNLAVFSIGFSVYFAAISVSWLAWSFWNAATVSTINSITMIATSVCCAYWAIFISAEGESVPVRIGHSWHVEEQRRLIGQLETMNASLLRTARR